MQLKTEIERVTIEQEADWLRVQSNADAALMASLEARLATLPGGSNGEQAKRLRPVLEERLKGVQARMWEMTKPNLRVNGFNYEDFVETIEPFDEALDRQIWSMNTERIMWETKVRERRRVMSDQVFDLMYNIEERRAAATWRPSEADLAAEASSTSDIRPEDVPTPPRHAEVVDTFAAVVENLSDLAKTAPQQLERAKRVHVVQKEIARLPA